MTSAFKEITQLPSWATLIRPKRAEGETTTNAFITNKSRESPDEPNEVEIEEGEVHMRKQCYHVLSAQMNQAMKDVIQESLYSSLVTLESYIDSSNPTQDSLRGDKGATTSSRKRQKQNSSTTKQPCLEGLDTVLFDQQQTTQSFRDPQLLPVVLMQGPFFGADRRAQVNSLATRFQKSRPQSAAIQMELGNGKNGMQELVRKCHSLCPILSIGPLSRRIAKRKKKKACSFSDLLLTWASLCEYKELVIFLNADEVFYSTELHDFLHWLATQRAEKGIPVNVAMLGPPEGRRPVELRSSRQGYAGFVVQSLKLPSCEHLLQSFWRRLWVEQKFPILFSGSVLQQLERAFIHHQKSCDRTLHKFSQLLASHFLQTGSFLTVAHYEPVRSIIWERMAWFVAYSGGGRMNMARNCGLTLHLLDDPALDYHKALLSLHLMRIIGIKKASSPFLHFQPSFSGFFRGTSKRVLLQGLLALRKEMDRSEDNISPAVGPTSQAHMTSYVSSVSVEAARQMVDESTKQQRSENARFINETILLVAKCRDGDDLSDIEKLLDEVVLAWIEFKAAVERKWRMLPQHKLQMPLAVNNPCLEECLTAEPRKQVVAALLQASDWKLQLDQNPPTTSGHDASYPPLDGISGIMYCLIQDRVAVTQEDWVEEFRQTVLEMGRSSMDSGNIFILFSLGLRYLKQCGLVAEKLRVGSRSDIIYERTKLVYCSALR